MREKVGNRSSQALSIKAPNHPCSRKTPPCSKGIETIADDAPSFSSPCRKTPPCSKGIETHHGVPRTRRSAVERPRPVPKGLRPDTLTNFDRFEKGRKTPPCSKGIETEDILRTELRQICRKTPPCSKGIETNRMFLCSFCFVERPRPVPKGLRLTECFFVPSVLSKDPALFQRD